MDEREEKYIKIKLNRNFISYINMYLFIATVSLRSLTDGVFLNTPLIYAKYIALGSGIVFSIIQIIYSRKKCKIFKREFLILSSMINLLIMISLLISLFTSEISVYFVQEVFFYFLPVLYAYCILNLLTFEQIKKSITYILILCVIGYVVSIGVDTFTLINLKNINFSQSYSPFESNFSSTISLVLCVYNIYFAENKVLKYLSILFALLTFKRMTVVCVVALLLLSIFIDLKKEISKPELFMIILFTATKVA